MQLELFPFQKRALKELHQKTYFARLGYNQTRAQQIVSFTAPTGAGKTIMMAALFEEIYYGSTELPSQENAIILWLSDSPELNLQSKNKIDMKSDRIPLSRTIVIEDDSFNQPALEEGYIYFLNTQKLGINSNLVKTGNKRSYTIWETLNTTIQENGENFYLVIDEAHRGARENIRNEQMTVMQKFIKGSSSNGMSPCPIVIGMSATIKRFEDLIAGSNSSRHTVIITPDEVRSSGLLKDRIVIKYPEDTHERQKGAVLLAATDEWMKKWDHWHQYCVEQHSPHVYPIFLIQVENATVDSISATNLSECLRIIEERSGITFKKGEVVHAFGGDSDTLEIDRLSVPYVEPSEISDDRQIRIVFFKESLTTGWDCPRAEVMVSYRKAKDATYIAQLLGRMVRTPLQRRINVDESLNDVHLYLPFFDENTVNEVIAVFNDSEVSDVSADVTGESIENPKNISLTVHLPKSHLTPNVVGSRPTNQTKSLPDIHSEKPFGESDSEIAEVDTVGGDVLPDDDNFSSSYQDTVREGENEDPEVIDRLGVIRYINELGLISSTIRRVRINDYLVSLFKLTRLLVHSNIDNTITESTLKEIVEMIETYIQELREKGIYKSSIDEIKQFKLSSRIVDVYGHLVESYLGELNFYTSSDEDVEAQFNRAEKLLGNNGIALAYGEGHYNPSDPNAFKLDVILFASNKDNLIRLESWAELRFNDIKDNNRRYIKASNNNIFEEFNKIVANSDIVTETLFRLPEEIYTTETDKTQPYEDHLQINDELGYAPFSLNSWEIDVLNEERAREDYVTWIRNKPNSKWGLSIPYELDLQTKQAFPDFIIVRKDDVTEYVVDLLEPHRGDLEDNLAKAKAFVTYARKNPVVGRIEMIRKVDGSRGQPLYRRLNLANTNIGNRVERATNLEDFNRIFEEESKYY